MVSFVNRTTELRLIDDAFTALLDKERLIKTPILAFHGVEGIGKTMILRQVVQRCHDENLPCIQADAHQGIPGFSRDILAQLSTYKNVHASSDEEGSWLDRSIDATRALLKQRPAVMLVDSLDPTNTEQVRWFEELFKNVLDKNVHGENKLFVILTSKRKLLFEQERSVARKLTSLELKPLDRESCQEFLNASGLQVEKEVSDSIYAWTRGYPLAMQVMLQAITAGLDPRKAQDQSSIVEAIVQQVIVQKILERVGSDRLDWFHSILRLLAIPRRFNLVLMKDLIEKFSPTFKRDSNLAYFVLPKEINEVTDVLTWNMLRAGFSIDATVRPIFLLEMKVALPETYYDAHAFLAQVNRERASRVSGLDRVRYLREYLYHVACQRNETNLPEQLQLTIQEVAEEPAETFLQFSEEFTQDEELQEALDDQKNFALSLIHQTLAQINRQFASATTGAERVRFLREVFDHLLDDPQTTDLAGTLKQQLDLLIRDETPEIVFNLYEELTQIEKFRTLLGDDIAVFATRIHDNLSLEG